jgi:hypothetical protein
METFYVEAALIKIASLTKVALGDAGMDILSVNLKGAEFNRKWFLKDSAMKENSLS